MNKEITIDQLAGIIEENLALPSGVCLGSVGAKPERCLLIHSLNKRFKLDRANIGLILKCTRQNVGYIIKKHKLFWKNSKLD